MLDCFRADTPAACLRRGAPARPGLRNGRDRSDGPPGDEIRRWVLVRRTAGIEAEPDQRRPIRARSGSSRSERLRPAGMPTGGRVCSRRRSPMPAGGAMIFLPAAMPPPLIRLSCGSNSSAPTSRGRGPRPLLAAEAARRASGGCAVAAEVATAVTHYRLRRSARRKWTNEVDVEPGSEAEQQQPEPGRGRAKWRRAWQESAADCDIGVLGAGGPSCPVQCGAGSCQRGIGRTEEPGCGTRLAAAGLGGPLIAVGAVDAGGSEARRRARPAEGGTRPHRGGRRIVVQFFQRITETSSSVRLLALVRGDPGEFHELHQLRLGHAAVGEQLADRRFAGFRGLHLGRRAGSRRHRPASGHRQASKCWKHASWFLPLVCGADCPVPAPWPSRSPAARGR